MFRGISPLTLDNKFRLAVPARHRDALLERCGGHLVITADADRCLLMYPLPEWELIQQKLESLSNMDPRVRELQRRLIGFAVDTEMDTAGRLLIAPGLRKYAELVSKVALVGQGARPGGERGRRCARQGRGAPQEGGRDPVGPAG